MTQNRFDYKYSVAYPRTHDWWNTHWRELATWCIQNFGPLPAWDYVDEKFWFTCEEHKVLFMLKWL